MNTTSRPRPRRRPALTLVWGLAAVMVSWVVPTGTPESADAMTEGAKAACPSPPTAAGTLNSDPKTDGEVESSVATPDAPGNPQPPGARCSYQPLPSSYPDSESIRLLIVAPKLPPPA